ncbi:hypothetical protein QQY66_45670 [Streptomyces sp. DG2A-72]|uniref:hypothetical protein n=1 Tax=Streptomyces sp. DG2A-72 TaxID=3051386 RepID=UPI00265C47F6|nr:hypothetical protein [Streptomyces sp. DG2A-72]MDO0938658.1 hypothetical protein [Streptomyces sp. DG2A-72]
MEFVIIAVCLIFVVAVVAFSFALFRGIRLLVRHARARATTAGQTGDDGVDRRAWLTMAAELAAILSLLVAIMALLK